MQGRYAVCFAYACVRIYCFFCSSDARPSAPVWRVGFTIAVVLSAGLGSLLFGYTLGFSSVPSTFRNKVLLDYCGECPGLL